MKKLILILALNSAISAHADSVSCQQDFKTFKETATNMLPLELRSQFSSIRMKIGEIPKLYNSMIQITKIGSIEMLRPAKAESSDNWEGELNGRAIFAHEQIYVTCNEDSETNRAVIAHELAHFIAKILNLPSDEDQANIFGAEIFAQSRVDSNLYLNLLDKSCETGNVYFCRRAQMWRVGLQGG